MIANLFLDNINVFSTINFNNFRSFCKYFTISF